MAVSASLLSGISEKEYENKTLIDVLSEIVSKTHVVNVETVDF